MTIKKQPSDDVLEDLLSQTPSESSSECGNRFPENLSDSDGEEELHGFHTEDEQAEVHEYHTEDDDSSSLDEENHLLQRRSESRTGSLASQSLEMLHKIKDKVKWFVSDHSPGHSNINRSRHSSLMMPDSDLDDVLEMQVQSTSSTSVTSPTKPTVFPVISHGLLPVVQPLSLHDSNCSAFKKVTKSQCPDVVVVPPVGRSASFETLKQAADTSLSVGSTGSLSVSHQPVLMCTQMDPTSGSFHSKVVPEKLSNEVTPGTTESRGSIV